MLIFKEYPQLLNGEFVEGYDFTRCYSRMNADGDPGELDTAVAIMVTGAVLSDMSKLLGRSRVTISSYIGKNPHLAELVDEVAETFLDEVEKLHKGAALQGDLGAQRFILTTLGKDRGYVTRTDHKVESKTQVTIEKEDADL
jgi:hypothetical protein